MRSAAWRKVLGRRIDLPKQARASEGLARCSLHRASVMTPCSTSAGLSSSTPGRRTSRGNPPLPRPVANVQVLSA